MDTSSSTPDYDAFGDRSAVVQMRNAGSRRARSAVVAIFWSVALLLVAGRVYQHDVAPQPHAMEFASR